MNFKYKAYELIWLSKNFRIEEFKVLNISDIEPDVTIEESFKEWDFLPESSKLNPFLSVYEKEIRLEKRAL